MNVWLFIFQALIFCIHQSHQDECYREDKNELCFSDNILYLYNYMRYDPRLSVNLSQYYRNISTCFIYGPKAECNGEKIMPVFSDFNYRLYYKVFTIFDSNLPTIRINTFIDMPNLVKINMTSCNVSDIEFGAFYGLSELKYMVLTKNSITNIRKGIFNLSNLKGLDLSMNKIKNIEDGSFFDVQFQEIRISKNEIQDASPLLESCQELVIFDISHNKVSSLESIGNCTNLLVLQAANNRLKELSPYLFSQLPLVMLDLSSNILINLDVNTFNGLNLLNILDLSDNKLNGQLSLGIFQDLHKLRILNLSSNSLSNLQLGIFSKLANVITLDVSNNKLSGFLEEMFYDLERITELYINNNLIKSLKGPPFEGKINIDGNPWNCQELSKTVKVYKNALIRGGNHNTSNIFGISCSELTSDEIVDPVDNRLNKNDDTTNMGSDIIGKSLQKIEQQFDKLLSLFNNTLPQANTLNYSAKLGGNIGVPHLAENSDLLVGVLVVLILFLIVFCLTVFYFIRSFKVYNHIRQIDEDQL